MQGRETGTDSPRRAPPLRKTTSSYLEAIHSGRATKVQGWAGESSLGREKTVSVLDVKATPLPVGPDVSTTKHGGAKVNRQRSFERPNAPERNDFLTERSASCGKRKRG